MADSVKKGAPCEVTTADLNTALSGLPTSGGTSANSNAVAPLAPPLADPDRETLRQKSNELRAARRRIRGSVGF